MAVPYTFGSATTSIPLSQLDSNFATTITLGNTAIQLGNTVTTLNNMTLVSPTLTTPALGTPASGIMTNVTGIPAAQITGSQAIPKSTLPTGSVLQVVYSNTNTQISATNADVNTYNFQCAITPLFSTSKMLVIASVNGIDNGGSGRLSTTLFQGTTGGDTSGTQLVNFQVASNSSGTSGMMSTSISYLTSAIGSTTTQYFKIINAKNDGSTTWYVQHYSTYSSLIVMEIAA